MTDVWPYPTNTVGLLTGMEGLAYPQFVPSPATYSQYPTDLLDYSIDWSDFLAMGDAIATSAWSAKTGLTLGRTAVTGTSTTVWVSGGVGGCRYTVFNTITTTGGRDATRVLQFKIKHADTYLSFATAESLQGGGRLSGAARMYSIHESAALPGHGTLI